MKYVILIGGKVMNISEKIKEMQGDLGKYHALEKKEGECGLENLVMLILNDGGQFGPGKIIGESSEFLDFMFYKRQGPIFSLSIKKEHLSGFSIFHKAIDDEKQAAANIGIPKALYQ